MKICFTLEIMFFEKIGSLNVENTLSPGYFLHECKETCQCEENEKDPEP